MSAFTGRDFLLQVNTAGGFATVGGMRTTSLRLDQQTFDATTLESGGWRGAAGGLRQVELRAGGVFENTAAEEQVRSAAFAGAVLDARLLFGNGDSLTGLFLITRYERSGSVDGEEAYTLTLQSAGEVVYALVS